ncbi:MAG: hypothetical protein P4K98_07030 [Bryobacteraceae bacterium]|nr:hypothetical protein [Bryobacteraceae bacterium]
MGPEIPSGWTITGGPGATLRLHHPSGLTVVRTAVVHPGSEAVEYAVRIKNDSRKDSAVLEDICALDVWFARQDAAATAVISSGGGMDDSKFPPRQYAIQRHELASAEVMLKTEGGRSSNLDLPFFFVQNDRAHEGLFVAIGWSGNWSASVCVAAHTHDLQLKGGIPGVQIRLKPGEEIGGPRIPRRRWPAPLRLVCRPHASVKNLGSIRTVPAALWT